MKKLLVTIGAALLAIGQAFAGTRSSANYSISAESLDGSGARLLGGSYAVNGSATGQTGAGGSAVATGGTYANKPGYVGELYDIVALSITLPPSTNLNESASRQLVAAPLADDNTTLAALDPSTVVWSVLSGPIASISSGGLATAATVYQDTAATVKGTALAMNGQLGLTVLNVGLDNYHEYAGDGIDDAWQVQYFGQPPNPLAAPGADPDGDGQTNLFEYTAGLIPNDPTSRFAVSVAPVAGQPGQKKLAFSPIVAGRTYKVTSKPILNLGSYTALSNPSAPTDIGTQRNITDLSASGATKFYHVEITKP